MNIVFTMAGKYNRFRLFGNKVPKYLLPLGSGTVLSNVIEVMKYNADNANFYFVANRDDQLFHPILKSILKRFKIPLSSLLYIDDTASQLQSAMMAMELLSEEEKDSPICFANIDTIVKNRKIFFQKLAECKENESLLDTFHGNSPSYSYIRTNDHHGVSHVLDKKVVSSFACSGLYGFGSYRKMADKAKDVLKINSAANFTELYNTFIEKSQRVDFLNSDDPNDTIVLGVPEEYLINIHRFGQ